MNTFETVYSEKLSKQFSRNKKVFVSGQNVNVGSHISGLSKVLKICNDKSNLTVLNNPNIETSLIGLNLGYLLTSQSTKCSCIFVKQADFVTLMMDDLVHTVNLLSSMNTVFSLNIITFVVDSGFEGPQSRWNAVSSLEENCNVKVIHLTTWDSLHSLKQIHDPGVRIFLISQRHFRDQIYVEASNHLINKPPLFCLGFSVYDAIHQNREFEKIAGPTSVVNLIPVPHRNDLDRNMVGTILSGGELIRVIDNSDDSRASCLRFLDYLASFGLPFSYELIATPERKKYGGISDEHYQYRVMFKGSINDASILKNQYSKSGG